MKIKTNFEQNIIPEQYGKHASDEYKLAGIPVTSFPFSVEDVPAEAKFLHIVLIDYDSIPVAGFPFIHWTVANIPADQTVFPENYSRDGSPKIQGVNSYSSFLLNGTPIEAKDEAIKTVYVGPGAPDKDHDYELFVYATTEEVNVEQGFPYNELRKQLSGKYIAKAHKYLIGKA